MDISPATVHEAEALSALAFRSKAHWGYPTHWLEEWRPQLTISPRLLREQLVSVARTEEGEPAGFYGLLVEGREASLEHLWVDPLHFGRGLGRDLFRHATEAARRRGCETLIIDSDPNAEEFYLRMGAVRRSTVAAPVAGIERELPRLHFDLLRESFERS